MHNTEVTEAILVYGHKNIEATHATTFEITKENHLTREGDCIIAVSANKSMQELSPKFKNALRRKNAKLKIWLEADQIAEVVNAFGSPQLTMTHAADMVVRKSEYICGRTLAIKADKAANELSKKLVAKLKDPTQKVKITLIVKV